MSEIELETKFEKIQLEEGPSRAKEESKCECKKAITKQLEHNTGSSLKVKERRKNLIKPARLKMIGTRWTRTPRCSESSEETQAPVTSEDLETFASDAFLGNAFLEMRITSQEQLSHTPGTPSASSPEEKDERTSPASQPNSCSAQAKLQQQFSSSEFDADIEEMSEFLAYHLKVYSQDKNYLVDSMYT